MTTVLVCGAGGRMGREVVNAVWQDSELQLVGAVDVSNAGMPVAEIVNNDDCQVVIMDDLQAALEATNPDVVVDFTSPKVVFENAKTTLQHGTNIVIGTTGLTADERDALAKIASEKRVGVLVAPNFSLGAVLLMQASELMAKYLPNAEIIELHHNQKYDAPSGTARLTAEKIAKARTLAPALDKTQESLAGARGGVVADVHIHSVRLPGYVAHQEVLFGGTGEIVTLRHDSLDRKSFMPGVLLACKKISQFTGLTYGLEHYLG